MAELIGGRRRDTLPAYASLLRYGDPALVRKVTEEAVAAGYQTIKLHETTLVAIEAGRAGAGEAVRLVADVNCGWSLDEAHELLLHMKRLDLYWVEEPVFPPDDAETLAAAS